MPPFSANLSLLSSLFFCPLLHPFISPSLPPSLAPCRIKCIRGAIHLLALSDTGSQLSADRKGPIKHWRTGNTVGQLIFYCTSERRTGSGVGSTRQTRWLTRGKYEAGDVHLTTASWRKMGDFNQSDRFKVVSATPCSFWTIHGVWEIRSTSHRITAEIVSSQYIIMCVWWNAA